MDSVYDLVISTLENEIEIRREAIEKLRLIKAKSNTLSKPIIRFTGFENVSESAHNNMD
jgi:hypothetical protein